MKLIYASASPFARKVRILIKELSLENSVQLHDAIAVSPVSNNTDLNLLNPLGMLPALQLDNGDSLYDSPVICEYLDCIADGPFFPAESIRRFKTLGLQALCDGILDILVAVRYETAMRPEELHWQTWIDHQHEKVERGLDVLEARCDQFESSPLIGEIAAACVLGYLDFRYADRDWRNGRPNLSNWYDKIKLRESIATTAPS